MASIDRWLAGQTSRRTFGKGVLGTAAIAALPGPGGTTDQKAATGVRQDIVLNGDDWQFKPVKLPFFGWEQQDTPLNRHFIRDAVNAVPATEWDTWHDVRVPMAWNSHNEFDFPDYWHYIHQGEYRRTFDVPSSVAGKRVTLHFEGVNWKAWVYVNGTLVNAEGFAGQDFTHEFALTPFDVDITGLVEPNSTGNTLRVVVQDITANFAGPSPREYSVVKYLMGVRGEYWNQNGDATPRLYHEAKSGLFKDVSLVATPKVFVEDVFVRPDRANDRITVEVTVRNTTAEARTVTVDNSVVTWPDGAPALTFVDKPTLTVPAGQRSKVVITQSWSDYKLWWPDDPMLYSMVTTLHPGRDSGTLDLRYDRFGVRDVKAVASADLTKRGVYLNGIRTALFGESIETNLQGLGLSGLAQDGLTFNGNWSLTRSYFSQVIDVAKSMNINVFRVHRGWALNQDLVDIADEKGMMLIAENPITAGAWEYPLNSTYYASGIDMVLRIAKHYRNHPAIVLWSISNENSRYNTDLTVGMKTGFNGGDPVNPDIQLVSADSETAEVASDGYFGGWPGKGDAYLTRNTNKTWFTYEENASYLQFDNDSRRASVIDSMRIFRQQRMSLGYDAKILLAFYNFQKVFALPASATPAQRESFTIPWSTKDISGPGYHAQYLWQAILNPYTAPATVNHMTAYTPPSQTLWQATYAPVAVFDRDWVDGAMHGPQLTTAYTPSRRLYVFNSDLTDRSTLVTVDWTLVNADEGSTIREGSFSEDVPLGGVLAHPLDTGSAPTDNVLLRLTASKSGTVRYDETLTFGVTPPPPAQPNPGGDVIVIDNGQSGTTTHGLSTSTQFSGAYGPNVAWSSAPRPGDFARFTPYIGSAGNYNIYVHVPLGLSGTQVLNVVWDDGGRQQRTVGIDLGTPGWVAVPGGPYPLQPSQAANYLELVPGGSSAVLVADAVTFQKVSGEVTTLTLDQSQQPANGATWEYLGRYPCVAGTACRVQITNDANGRVIADAVRFVRGDTTITLDEDQATATGAWLTSAKPNSYGGDVYYVDPASPATATITYTPRITEPGDYDVYLTWDNNNGNQRGTNVPVTIRTDPVQPPSGWDVLSDDMSTPAQWSNVGTGGSTTWGSGTARIVDSSVVDYYAITRNGFTPPGGAFTYEFTGHTNTSANSGSSEVAVRSGAYYIRVILNHGTSGSVTDNYGSAAKSYTLDTTVDHTYRVIVHSDYTYDLYVDAALAWAAAANKGTSGSNILKVGSEPTTRADVTIDQINVGTGERRP